MRRRAKERGPAAGFVAAFASALLCATPGFTAELFDHNGSQMLVDYDSGTISYQTVKPALRKVISPGAILFSGVIERGRFARGTAYTFRRGCPAAGYEVSGRYDAELPGFILSGAAPHRPAAGCDILSYKTSSPHARLIFIDSGASSRLKVEPSASASETTVEKKATAIAPRPIQPAATP